MSAKIAMYVRMPRVPRKITTELPLPTEAQVEIDTFVQAGLNRLGLPTVASAQEIVYALREHLDAQRAAIHTLDHGSDEYAYFILELGHALGAQIVRTYGWHWGVLQFDGEDGGTHVIHPDGLACVHPIRLIMDIVNSPERGNNTALLFNMLAPGQLPQVGPGSYLGLN